MNNLLNWLIVLVVIAALVVSIVALVLPCKSGFEDGATCLKNDPLVPCFKGTMLSQKECCSGKCINQRHPTPTSCNPHLPDGSGGTDYYCICSGEECKSTGGKCSKSEDCCTDTDICLGSRCRPKSGSGSEYEGCNVQYPCNGEPDLNCVKKIDGKFAGICSGLENDCVCQKCGDCHKGIGCCNNIENECSGAGVYDTCSPRRKCGGKILKEDESCVLYSE